MDHTLEELEGCEKKDMGVTSQPTGAVPPQLHLDVYRGTNSWKVRCRLTPAIEGTNESFYLAPGTYATGQANWGANYFGEHFEGRSTEIHGIVDQTNSNRSRDAEQEHCDDWLRAHAITLKAAETVIRSAAAGLENRRFASKRLAFAGARDAFVGHSPHDRIAEAFRCSIAADLTNQRFTPWMFRDHLVTLFRDVGHLSALRDRNGWHNFTFGASVPNSQLSWSDWLSARGRDYRPVIPSGTFQVGTTTSAQLIHL